MTLKINLIVQQLIHIPIEFKCNKFSEEEEYSIGYV